MGVKSNLYRLAHAACVLLAWGALCLGQEQEKEVAASEAQAEPDISRVTRPLDAVAMSYADAKAIYEHDALSVAVMRYISVYEADETTRAGISYAVNTAMLHSADSRRVVPVGNGTVFRLNVAELVDFDEKLTRLLLDTWDRMTDETFYLQTDKAVLKLAAPYKHTDGRRYTAVNAKVQIPAPHADATGELSELCKLTGSIVPIISAGQFMRFALNSDFGGLYPDFRNFDKAPEKGSFEESLLIRAGVDLKEIERRKSDQRVACHGTPTGQPRIVEYANAAVTQPDKGAMVVSITRDFLAGPIRADKHPFENLGDRKHDNSELFVPTASGNLDFALSDGNGNFVASAPPNAAADRTIPAGFLPILQGASGCIRCHMVTNPETKRLAIYQPAPNYITYMRQVRIGDLQFDVLAENGDQGKELARLVSLFKGETDGPFAYSGRAYANFVFEATGLPLEAASAAMFKIHDGHLYEFVTPKKFMLMQGYKTASDEQAVELLNTVCPPQTMVVDGVVKSIREPLRITELRAFTAAKNATPSVQIKMTIDDSLAIYSEVALRIQAYEQGQAQQVLGAVK